MQSDSLLLIALQALTTLENIISRLRDLDEGRLTPPSTPQRLPRSSPASPAASKKNKRQQSNSPIRHILNSPLLNRRQRKKPSIIESSDDEGNQTNGSGEEMGNGSGNGNGGNGKQYRDLETFQKAQLRQKVRLRYLCENITKIYNDSLLIHSLNAARSSRMAVPVAPIQRQCAVSL